MEIIGKAQNKLKNPRNKNLKELFYNFTSEAGLFGEINFEEKNRVIGTKIGLSDTITGNYSQIDFMGQGVISSLTLISLLILNNTTFFSEPETNLHPKAQARLGKFIYDIKKMEKNKNPLFIETHSDFIIERFKFENKLDKFKTSVLYFSKENKKITFHEIPIILGDYEETNSDFGDFFLSELMETSSEK
jgi:predicted ATPase